MAIRGGVFYKKNTMIVIGIDDQVFLKKNKKTPYRHDVMAVTYMH
jgi:hypothetical protein